MVSPVEAVSLRIESMWPTAKVYRNGPPETVATSYIVVSSNAGVVGSDRLSDQATQRDVTVWVKAIGRYPKGENGRAAAAFNAQLWAERAQSAMIGWRPAGGWKPVPLASQPVTRDEDIPTEFVYYAVDTYGLSQSI